MKQNEMPSRTAMGAMFALSMVFAVLVILAPNFLNAGEDSATTVPDPGTAEYEAFLDEFKNQNGHEYDIQDQMAAIHNGGIVMVGYFGICFAFMTVQYAIYDCYRYAVYKKSGDPPRTVKNQAIRTGIAMASATLLGCWYFLAPWLMKAA